MPDVNEILKPNPVLSTENNLVKPREIVDRKPGAFVPRELQSFLQKIELDPVSAHSADPNGQPQLSPTAPTNPKIVLPVTRTSFIAGFKNKVDDVSRWLSVFIFREIKLKDGTVSFKSDDS